MKKSNLLLLGFLLSLFALFFVGDSSYYSTRSFRIAWNLGHIVFFTLAVLLLLQHAPFLYKKTRLGQFWWVIGICLIIGILVESIQFFIGRQADWADILRNILGGLTGLVFFPHSKFKGTATFGIRSKVAIFILLCVQLYPLLLTLSNERMARSRFPVLSNFESQLELTSWHSDGSMTLDNSISANGHYSARIEFTTKKYSGASLDYFPGNWKNYKQLLFSIYLSDLPALPLNYRIHDKQHNQNDNRYNDRFNRQVLLQMGWNHITVDLSDVISAPQTRSMDIESITNIQFFGIGLKQHRVVYLDNLRLK